MAITFTCIGWFLTELIIFSRMYFEFLGVAMIFSVLGLIVAIFEKKIDGIKQNG